MTQRAWTSVFWLCCILLAWVALSPILAADPPAAAEARKYVRVERDKSGEPLALQTAVVRFASTEAAQSDRFVDLIGAVHVGEKAYYEGLNKAFENYDVVLYELVAPEGTRVPKGAKPGNHPVAMLQNGFKDMLGLEHQLQYIDYTKSNLMHADMSPDDFSKSMADRNESFMSMYFRMMGAALAQQSKLQNQGKSSEFDILMALFDKDRARALKRLMADQFENLEGVMSALDGPQGSTIVTERNKVALKKLAEQIADGKKKIAIFYGAAHLPDMERRLVAEFHLQRATENWFTAWRLDKPAAAPIKPEVNKPRAQVSPRRNRPAQPNLLTRVFAGH
ncbi:MAG: hypothetical protein HY288_04030 [Planctomycetia bacterium]|nr:hypothetical protein [Planctomycetia bacterium]